MQIQGTNKALIAFAASLFLAYLLPYHVNPYPSFYNDWLVALGCVVALVYCSQAKYVVSIPSVGLIPIVLAIILLIQTSLDMLSEPWDVVLPTAYFLMAALAIVLGATVSKGGADKPCAALAYAHLWAGLISAVIATCQFTGIEIYFVPYMMEMLHLKNTVLRPVGNIAQTNQLALLFCLGIASAWWLSQTKRLCNAAALGMVLFLIFGLSLTQSRIGWIIVPLLAFYCRRWASQENRISIPVAMGLVLAYFALVVCLPTIATLWGAEASFAINRSTAISARSILFKQAWEMSVTHPWFGVGWYQFGREQIEIGATFPTSVYSAHAHNIVLNFAAELGWPITLVMFGSLLYWIWRAFPVARSNRETAFAFLCFIAVIVHSMVEYPLWYGYVLFPICFLIGMVHQQQFGAKQLVCSGKWLAALALISMVALVGVAMDYRRVVVGYWWNNLEALAVSMGADKVEKPEITIFPQFYDYFQFLKTTVHPGMSAEEIAAMEKTVRRFGYGASLLRLSLAYGLNNREDEAVKTMLTIRSLDPLYYEEAYGAWKRTAEDHSEYRPLLQRLPLPNTYPD